MGVQQQQVDIGGHLLHHGVAGRGETGVRLTRKPLDRGVFRGEFRMLRAAVVVDVNR